MVLWQQAGASKIPPRLEECRGCVEECSMPSCAGQKLQLCAVGCWMLSAQCSQSVLRPCLHVLLLHGFGCAEDSLADFTGLPDSFVTGCSTHGTSQLGDLVLRLSTNPLLPEEWWVLSSTPVKVLKAITPTEALLWRLGRRGSAVVLPLIFITSIPC